MGFLQPGKRLKRQRATPEPEEQPESKTIKKRAISLLTIQDLPIEILHEIFILSEPGNSLPLVNKYFSNALKFDPFYCLYPWKNISLALSVIHHHFWHSLNGMYEFVKVREKYAHYVGVHKTLSESHSYSRYLAPMLITLDRIEFQFKAYTLDEGAISTDILHYKFISGRLLEMIFDQYPGGFVNHKSIPKRILHRPLYFTLAYKLLAWLADKVVNLHPNDATIHVTKEELVNYTDDTLPTLMPLNEDVLEGFCNRDYHRFNLKENKILYFHLPDSEVHIPETLYRSRIPTWESIDLLRVLGNNGGLIKDINRFLVDTIEYFFPEHISKINLEEVSIISVTRLSYSRPLEQSTIVKYFKLYHSYSLGSPDLTNMHGGTLLEDIATSIKLLLDVHFKTPVHLNMCDELWRFVEQHDNQYLGSTLLAYTGPSTFL